MNIYEDIILQFFKEIKNILICIFVVLILLLTYFIFDKLVQYKEQNDNKIPIATSTPIINNTPILENTPTSTPIIKDVTNNKYLGSGTVSWFGGEEDKNCKDIFLLTNESSNSKGYYCAMRWNYKRFHPNLREARKIISQQIIRVIFENKYVDCKPVDFGPAKKTNRIINLSYDAIKELGIDTDKEIVDVFIK